VAYADVFHQPAAGADAGGPFVAGVDGDERFDAGSFSELDVV
jgi:hypothetical protein